ncbi:MAG: hypothetical protein QFX32_03565 [Methanolinea sp.]|nr:hypothetical protein [Methanolinea sp.]
MQESTTRVILLVVIMAFGTLMLLFDLPFFYLLLGAVALAFLVLLVTGTVRMPSLKREKKVVPAGEKPAKKPLFRREKEEKKPSPRKDAQGLREFFSSLKKAFALLGKDLVKTRSSRAGEQEKSKKIDTLLDKTVKGEAITSLEDVIPEAAPVEKKKEEDPFAALVGEDLNPDLLSGIEEAPEFSIPGDEDLGIDIPAPVEISDSEPASGESQVTQMDLSLAAEEESITIDETNDADEVKEILEAHKDELEMEVPLPSEDLVDIESIDLEGIEIEGDTTPSQPATPAAPAKSPPAPAKGSAAPPSPKPTGAEPKSIPSAPEPEMEMLSFGTGKREDDDLMAALKTEVKAKKKGEYASLVRDLKDLKIDAADLQKELEELLKPRKSGKL